jgi:ribosome-binding protein aMBF1 (putative translation factor)
MKPPNIDIADGHSPTRSRRVESNHLIVDRLGELGPERSQQREARVELALGQLIYDLRTSAGVSQRELAGRMRTTQSVIPRLEEGGGAKNRLDTLARVATALDRLLVVSFPEKVPLV